MNEQGIHPIIIRQKEIEDIGLAVLHNVGSYNQEYVSPYLIIALITSGSIDVDIDLTPNTYSQGDVIIISPYHAVRDQHPNAEYSSTLVAVSQKMCAELVQRHNFRMLNKFSRKQKMARPSQQQFDALQNVMNIIDSISKFSTPRRWELLVNMIDILMHMLDEYNSDNTIESKEVSGFELLFMKFCNAIFEHHCEHHEVKYYAELLNTSPKYFAQIIKKNTGISASKWINDYIIIHAKSLLQNHSELSIQEIAYKLGFNEQGSFSRFFKKQTKVTPSQFRISR